VIPAVHVLVPEGIDDPARPSGGNRYDRKICDGLRSAGWTVAEHAVAGRWPAGPSAVVADVLRGLPAGALVLIDGLVGCAVPDVLSPEAARLRLVLIVHMPLGDERERAALPAAAAVVATSRWTEQLLLERYRLAAPRVHVAEPGVDPAPLAAGSPSGTELLCVGAITSVKGHDILFAALDRVAGIGLRCTCVGSLDREPDFVARLRLPPSARLVGPLVGPELDAAYAAADVLVLASRAETYGMVITEALARGLPVIATDVGGVAETLGHTAAGDRPGLLVPPADPAALGEAIRRWTSDRGLRAALRAAARERRRSLPGWESTTARIAGVLNSVSVGA
jgi:glycosyltransferase involved in cell wall biosynthesis